MPSKVSVTGAFSVPCQESSEVCQLLPPEIRQRRQEAQDDRQSISDVEDSSERRHLRLLPQLLRHVERVHAVQPRSLSVPA